MRKPFSQMDLAEILPIELPRLLQQRGKHLYRVYCCLLHTLRRRFLVLLYCECLRFRMHQVVAQAYSQAKQIVCLGTPINLMTAGEPWDEHPFAEQIDPANVLLEVIITQQPTSCVVDVKFRRRAREDYSDRSMFVDELARFVSLVEPNKMGIVQRIFIAA